MVNKGMSVITTHVALPSNSLSAPSSTVGPPATTGAGIILLVGYTSEGTKI